LCQLVAAGQDAQLFEGFPLFREPLWRPVSGCSSVIARFERAAGAEKEC